MDAKQYNSTHQLPEPQLNDQIELAYLALFFFIGAPLNLAAFAKLSKQLKVVGLTRLLWLKLHLNITDLMVIFIYVVAEFFWLFTYDWRGGAVLCPIVMYLFAVAFHASSFVIVCIALDRVFAVMWTKVYNQGKALKICQRMVIIAWALSFLASIPQLFIFVYYEPFPEHPEFGQCVSKWEKQRHLDHLNDTYFLEEIINGISVMTLFAIPAFTVVICYLKIFFWMQKNVRFIRRYSTNDSVTSVRRTSEYTSLATNAALKNIAPSNVIEPYHMHRTSSPISWEQNRIKFVVRRKNKILWMSCLIVAAYILCWSPYYVLCIYFYAVDYESFSNVQNKYYFLSALIVFNSVINPLLYDGSSLPIATNCCTVCRKHDKHYNI